MLDAHELDAFFADHFHLRAFRQEIGEDYAGANEQDTLTRYLNNEPAPRSLFENPFLDELRADDRAGKQWQWVHVVRRRPLSAYLRCAFEWGYPANVQAGAQVRILDLTEQPAPSGFVDEEFWTLDQEAGLRMLYDDGGGFIGAEAVKDVERYLRARDVVWSSAVPLSRYWQAHPQYHRTQAA